MPGILGFLTGNALPTHEERNAACGALMHGPEEEVQAVAMGPVWLAAVGLPGQIPRIHELPGGDIIMVWGDLFAKGTRSFSVGEVAAYAADPKGMVSGVYSVVHWNAASRTISVFTDYFGARPVYYGEHTGTLAFASRPKGVCALLSERPKWNPVAAFDILAFGSLTGETTWFDKIRHLPPASRLSATPLQPRWKVRSLPIQSYHHDVPAASAIDRFIPLVKQAVARSVKNAKRVTVLSSGGMDSRLVWAALPGGDLKATGLSFGPPDLPDVVVAREICSVLKTPHCNLQITPEHVRTLGPEVVRLTDGSVPFLHSVGNLLAAREGPAADAVLDGVEGWIVARHPKAWLLSRQRLIHKTVLLDQPGVVANLLTQDLAPEFFHHVRARLADFYQLGEAGTRHDCLMAMDSVALRMYLQASLIKLGSVTAASPLYDLDLVLFVRALPPRLRINKFFEAWAIRLLAPELANLHYTETGYPLRSITNPYMVFLQKLRQRLKPLPYFDRGRRLFNLYDRWIGDELSDWFRQIFEDRSTAVDTMIPPGVPTRLLTVHRSRGGQAEMLIRLATIFLWFQQQDESSVWHPKHYIQTSGRW